MQITSNKISNTKYVQIYLTEENMKKEFIEQILEKLENDLHIEKNADFIGELFDDRADTIHFEITKHKEYKKYIDEINKIDEEIKEKFNSYWDIIKILVTQ